MTTSRRQFASIALGLSLATLFGPPAMAARYRRIPQRPSARVIIDNDFAGDPDALIALAHQLITPKTRTVLITASALDRKIKSDVPADRSAEFGRNLALETLRRAGIKDSPPVVAGSEHLNLEVPETSAAAKAIVAEALRDDPLPLFVTCGGPLTNIAAALRQEPKIATRMTVIWIGGGAYPHGAWEYNLSADLHAARSVIERSHVPLWQIPQSTYAQMQVSVAELATRLRPISSFGAWLYDKFTTPPSFVDVGGTWALGDSPTVLLSALSQHSSLSVDRDALRIEDDATYGSVVPDRKIRVFESIDARLTFEDFLALMRLHEESKQ